MNERIRELLEQVGVKYVTMPDDTVYEKFAELIIDDVLTILADQKNYNRCTYTTFDIDKGLCVTSELTKKIKEQFGNKQ